MTNSTHDWRRDGSGQLGATHSYSVLRVDAPDAGLLRFLDSRSFVAVRGALLVLIASSNVRSPASIAALQTGLTELLACSDRTEDGKEAVKLARKRLGEMFFSGAFCQGVPDGILAGVGPSGLHTFRFGSVNAAAVENANLRLLYEDDRYPALRRLGVDLGTNPPWMNPFFENVSSLVQLDPSTSPPALATEVGPDGHLLLFSRGALPFRDPTPGETPGSWATSDAGWRHGMSGVIVEIRGTRSPTLFEDPLWFVEGEASHATQ